MPASLTGVVAIAAGGAHALGLKADGTVAAWGSNGSGESSTNGLNLTNVMAIAAGYTHSLALRNDRTVVAWGNNTYGQTNVPSLISVKLLAAGGFHRLISFFSPWVQYPVDVTKDLLLVYNTNSLDSSNVCAYYLAHRPMVTGANVLPIGCAAQETVTRPDYTNTVRQPILSWLNANPTKRPQYWILFLDIPSRINANTNSGVYTHAPYDNSVSYELYATLGNNPFVTHINMNGTNDCIAYIDKLASIATNYSLGKVVISGNSGGYGNTNYYFDDTRPGYLSPKPWAANDAKTGVLNVNPAASVIYSNKPYGGTIADHITNATNLAGFLSWGVHGYNYDTNA